MEWRFLVPFFPVIKMVHFARMVELDIHVGLRNLCLRDCEFESRCGHFMNKCQLEFERFKDEFPEASLGSAYRREEKCGGGCCDQVYAGYRVL
jgi:hypothetical protein